MTLTLTDTLTIIDSDLNDFDITIIDTLAIIHSDLNDKFKTLILFT